MRCFVSAEISDDLRDKIEKIQQNFKNPGTKLVKRENFHFTLKFLGEISEERAEEAGKRLESINSKPFPIMIKGLGAFPNIRFPSIIWTGCESPELAELARFIDSSMAEIGFPLEKNYVSHITVARIKYRQQGLSELLSQLENIEIGPMNLDEIRLKQSILGKKGPVYKDIGIYKLAL